MVKKIAKWNKAIYIKGHPFSWSTKCQVQEQRMFTHHLDLVVIEVIVVMVHHFHHDIICTFILILESFSKKIYVCVYFYYIIYDVYIYTYIYMI